ncbi:MAG: hypothetical protein K8R18_02430 [Parvibaculum sp.]|uniref:DUF6640 family protein n=1 Tax=Parvibaculum sp. TaxID=2024848 RepID=UPI0025D8E213|nr:DUF6640 family protein [Parvibaculum sp.]MCE9648457.1 hypothetical protein [Parvibaculum sp.]
METLFDQLLVPRLLFTLVAVAISVGPIFADFNKTHATNPLWTPHARFHVVWQVLSQTGVSAIILYLLWTDVADYATHIAVAALLNYVWGASFYTTLASMKLYGGALKDVNGIKPFRFNIFGRIHLVDTNLFGGTVLMIVNTVGVLLLAN